MKLDFRFSRAGTAIALFLIVFVTGTAQARVPGTGSGGTRGTGTGLSPAQAEQQRLLAEALKRQQEQFKKDQDAARQTLQDVQEKTRQAKLALKSVGRMILEWGDRWPKIAANNKQIAVPEIAANKIRSIADAKNLTALSLATESGPPGKVPVEGVALDDVAGLKRVGGAFMGRMGVMAAVAKQASGKPNGWDIYPSESETEPPLPETLTRQGGVNFLFNRFQATMTTDLTGVLRQSVARLPPLLPPTPPPGTGAGAPVRPDDPTSAPAPKTGVEPTGWNLPSGGDLWRFVEILMAPFQVPLAYAAEIAFGVPIVGKNMTDLYKSVAEDVRVKAGMSEDERARVTQSELDAAHNAANDPSSPFVAGAGGPFFRRTALAFSQAVPAAEKVLAEGQAQLTGLLGKVDDADRQLKALNKQANDALATLNRPSPQAASAGGAPGSGAGQGTGSGSGSGSDQAKNGGGSGGGGGGGSGGGGDGGKGSKPESPKPPEMAKMEVPKSPNFDGANMEDVQPVVGLAPPTPSEDTAQGRGALPGGPLNSFPLSLKGKQPNTERVSFFDPARVAANPGTFLQGQGKPGSAMGNAGGGMPDLGGAPAKGESPGSAGAMGKGSSSGDDGVFNLSKDDDGGGRFVNNFVKPVDFGSGGGAGGGTVGESVASAGTSTATDEDAASAALAKADLKQGLSLAQQIRAARPSVLARVRMLGIMGYVGTFGELCQPRPGESGRMGICSKPKPTAEARAAFSAPPATTAAPVIALAPRAPGESAPQPTVATATALLAGATPAADKKLPPSSEGTLSAAALLSSAAALETAPPKGPALATPELPTGLVAKKDPYSRRDLAGSRDGMVVK